MPDAITMIAVWNGAEIARSDDCLIVEGSYYFPLTSIDRDLLRPGPHRSRCPMKGEASYFDLRVDGHSLSHAAWFYANPAAAFVHLENRVAFWRGVQVLEAGEQAHAVDSTAAASAQDPAEQERLYEFLSKIPKTEIHLHLEALVSCESIYRLMRENQVNIDGVESQGDLLRRFQVRTLEQFIDLYINVIQPCLLKAQDFDLILRDARDYLKRNRIYYAEIFWAPTKFMQNGLEYAEMLDVLDAGARRIKSEDNIHIKFLVDLSRSYGPENAGRNLDLVLAHPRDCVIGVGLGGAEENNPARDYEAVFERAREAGLHAVAHAGEAVGPSQVWEAIRTLQVERIGHGTSAVLDERLLDHLAETQLPLEVCPSSNVFTRAYVHELREHPIRNFFERGLNVTVNTDDPTIFGIELSDEYLNLYNHCGFDLNEILVLIRNNLNASFLSDRNKANCWRQVRERVAKLQDRLGFQLTIP
ncbi:MAG: adenosine deaminase [bacterium]|nr:adenosine deaminase [bacterium]